MRISSQLLLTFLLNSLWQIALIAGLAAAGSWLLRELAARYRHWVWASALCLALVVPVVTALRTLDDPVPVPELNSYSVLRTEPFSQNEIAQSSSATGFSLPSTFQLNQTLGFVLLALFFGFLLYRVFKLVQAWQTTRTIRRLAVPLDPDERIAEIIRRCEQQIGTQQGMVKVFRSETLPVPVTVGLFHPVIILPEQLLREGNIELLTTAIGHEFIHVARRDYLLNFIYELVFVPISFHPAAAFIKTSCQTNPRTLLRRACCRANLER